MPCDLRPLVVPVLSYDVPVCVCSCLPPGSVSARFPVPTPARALAVPASPATAFRPSSLMLRRRPGVPAALSPATTINGHLCCVTIVANYSLWAVPIHTVWGG